LATISEGRGQTQAHGHAAHDAHGHGHTPHLAHHFDSLGQQKEAATLGMWAFLTTEIMLFGGIFMGYIAYRWAFPEIWEAAAPTLNTPLATVNTVVLLVSSLTVALAVNAAESGNKRRVITMLLVTIVLGFGFLGIKGYEYAEKFSHCNGYSSPIAWVTNTGRHAVEECLVPGRAFLFPEEHGAHAGTGAAHGAEGGASEGAPAEETGGVVDEANNDQSSSTTDVVRNNATPHQLFYFLYFSATGLHAIHMIIGITMMSILAWMAWANKFTPEWFTPVENGGLYWHLIDIIWVFLFPLFYLV